MGKQIVLEGERIATGYRQGKQVAEVHHGLDFSLSGGELTCLLGCNGAGKSTLLRTLAGMQPPLSGRLELMGRPLEAYSAHERSKTIGVVLTDRMQAGGLTVYELVALGRQPLRSARCGALKPWYGGRWKRSAWTERRVVMWPNCLTGSVRKP